MTLWQQATDRPEATSLLGKPLYRPAVPEATRAKLEADVAAAFDLAKREPSAEAIIWLGRRTAYLGKFREAIEVYAGGLRLYPDDPRIYRHRGHRYITVRQFDLAIQDLQKAVSLTAGKPDEVEPDGQPNARNIPIGTLKSNIDYHMALAYYLTGRYDRALPIYARELRDARNDDRRVSMAHWYYMALRRLGRDAEAAAVVAPLKGQMNVIENDTYRDLVRLYRGEIPPDSVLSSDGAGEMSVTDATAAYGIANWHLYNGRRAEGERILRRIIAGGQWGAFGYIAAEADLARIRRP